MPVERLEHLVRQSIDGYGSDTEAAVFGTTIAAEIAEAVIDHATGTVGPIAEAVFYRIGVGAVAGLRAQNGEGVVVKVHRWNTSTERLEAVQRVQSHLAQRGLPAPRPLDPPRALGNGWATVEELIEAGDADGHQPSVRRAVAAMLHQFVEAARSLDGVAVGPPAFIAAPGDPLWGEPHDVRFDFDATARGADWIDDAAEDARSTLHSVPAELSVVGHFDWRTENLGFVDGHIVAIYDWDSLGWADEAVIVGAAAAQFCAHWRLGHPVASPDEIDLFIQDYQRARQRPFREHNAERIDAASTALIAYGARCEHSDRQLRPDLALADNQGWTGLLRARLGPPHA